MILWRRLAPPTTGNDATLSTANTNALVTPRARSRPPPSHDAVEPFDPEHYLTPEQTDQTPVSPTHISPSHADPSPHVEINHFRASPGQHYSLHPPSPVTPTYNDPPTPDSWGDNIIDSPSCCRIVLQNINGLRDKSEMLAHRTSELNIDILGLVETNTDWDWKNLKSKTIGKIRTHFSRSTFAFSNSRIHFNSAFQPGGTLTLATNKWSTRSEPSTDPHSMGRWSVITLSGRNNRKTTIFSVYRVCDQVFASSGEKTAFRQQYLIASEDQEGRSPLHPRQQVLQDLETSITKIRSESHSIIILMDANESALTYQSKIASWMNRLSLVDPLTTRHGHLDQPPSVFHGSARIDMILTTRDLAHYIVAIGSLPHDFLIPSDHRPLFLDIQLEEYLNGIPYDKISHSQRGIQSDNPKAVLKYQTILTSRLSASSIEHDTEYLVQQQLLNGSLSQHQIERAKSIDRNLLKLKLAAERKCRHITKTPWSPKLYELKAKSFYWNSWLCQFRTHQDGSAFRRRMCPDSPEASLRSSQTAFKNALSEAGKMRNTHLTELATLMSNTGHTPAAKIVNILLRREHDKDVYRNCHRALHRPIPTPVAHILIPSPRGTLTSVSDQAPMEAALTHRNLRHFSQADGTPFASSPLSRLLGPHGTSPACNQLLRGSFPTDDITASEATRAILRNIPLGPVTPIDPHIYVDELMQSFRRWRESTSTSPSGDHLGHDHAILRKPKRCKISDDPHDQLDYRIFAIKAKLLNLAVQNTIVYDRWKIVVNAMIEKIRGLPLLEKFRIIHIISADFNMFTGSLFGHRMMAHGEALHQFGEEQSGSRKNKDCQDVQLLKHCIFSCVRLSRSNGSTFDNDAKSCFDRIVMILPSILAQRLGMSPKVCDLFLATLSQIHYHTKTIHGISAESYSTTPEHTIHGPGQGSRAAPAIWTIISCFLLSLMKEKSQGVNLSDPENTISFHQSSSGFVDDITHWNIHLRDSVLSPESSLTVAQTTSTLAQWWESLLHSSGGKLELSKCFYYTFHWQFDDAGNASFSPSVGSPQISIVDSSTDTRTTIEHKECSESHKTLGKMENPSGNYDDEAIRIKDKADGYGHYISASGLNRLEAYVLYIRMFLPAITYGFSSGAMSIAQCERAQSHAMLAFLPKLGYHRNTPRDVVYAEQKWGGCGMRHLFSEQGTKQSRALLRHIRTRSELGAALIIQLK